MFPTKVAALIVMVDPLKAKTDAADASIVTL